MLRYFILLVFLALGPVTFSPDGTPANGPARHPAVSADGRFIAFESDATNLHPGDANGQTDIFLLDRQSGETRLVSVSPAGAQGTGPSSSPAISGNGRLIVFESAASNLTPGDFNNQPDIFAFDRLTGLVHRVSVGRQGREPDGPSRSPAVDAAGRYVAFRSAASNLVFADGSPAEDIYVFDMVTGNMILVSAGFGSSAPPAISGDGRIIAYASAAGEVVVYHRVLDRSTVLGAGEGRPALSFSGRNVAYLSGGEVRLLDRDTGAARTLLPAGEGARALAMSSDAGAMLVDLAEKLALLSDAGRTEISLEGPLEGLGLSAGGEVLVVAAPPTSSAHSQILVEQLTTRGPSFHLAGRVTDAEGVPLALVTISDGQGGSTRTDAGGYFYLSGYPAGPLTLTPEKEGYTFEPSSWNLSVFRDVAGYLFTASAEETVLEEARKNIGMPYSFNRGCEDPYIGCGKPFHGFAAGFCTDLVLDAYTHGLSFEINYALQQDAYANPEHFYRWRDARNTHDMWRYFHFSGQMLDHSEDYLPGDAVFFDWSGDGEIDHVALVSEVVAGRPVRMVDATGITDQNPSGLAAELDWLGFHEHTVRGHARWDGTYEPVRSGYPPGARVLQTALSGGGMFMRVIDEQGRTHSFGETGIPGGVHFDLTWEEVISLLEPTGAYRVEIRSVSEGFEPYVFSLQTLSNGLITGRAELRGIIRPGEVVHYEWMVGEDHAGELFLRTDSRLRHARVSGVLRKP